MKNFIEFSEDGTSFVIKFANGFKTLEIGYKEEGIEAIIQFASNKKITPEEFAEMRDQVLNAEKLPWNEFMGEPLTLAAINSIANIMAYPKPVELAYFEVCPFCKKHGRIYTKTCYTGDLYSKRKAILYLNALGESLTKEEFQKVKTEIETSPIEE